MATRNLTIHDGIQALLPRELMQPVSLASCGVSPPRERGGYYPTCDHGGPEEVSLANYRHRCLELGG